jgi:hypothetical protein
VLGVVVVHAVQAFLPMQRRQKGQFDPSRAHRRHQLGKWSDRLPIHGALPRYAVPDRLLEHRLSPRALSNRWPDRIIARMLNFRKNHDELEEADLKLR